MILKRVLVRLEKNLGEYLIIDHNYVALFRLQLQYYTALQSDVVGSRTPLMLFIIQK